MPRRTLEASRHWNLRGVYTRGPCSPGSFPVRIRVAATVPAQTAHPNTSARTDRSINTARRRHLLTQPAIGVQSGPARHRVSSRAAEHTRHYANLSLEVASTSVGLFVLRTGGIGGRASLSAADVVSNRVACSRV
ncbi:hypothetical protein MRX96_019088 [Rhipicephalus microplus]